MDADGNGQYENDLDCQWVVVGTEGLVLAMSFTRFNVEDKSNGTADDPCWDYVEVMRAFICNLEISNFQI